MPNVSRKPTVTLLRDELSVYLAKRDEPSISAGHAASDGNSNGVNSIMEYIRSNGDMTGLSPLDLLNFGNFCHLDFHRLLALLVKGEWEWYASSRLPAGKTLKDIINEGLSSVRELSGGFSQSMDCAGLYRLFEEYGGMAGKSGYDKNDFQDLINHMVLADVHLFAGKSPELANFIAGEEAQRSLLKGVSEESSEEFWKKKRIWIELENEVEGLLLMLEEQTLRNRKVQRKWMARFGSIYIPLLESEYRFTSLNYRIRCKEEDPTLTLEKLEELEDENRQLEETYIAKLKKNAVAIKKDLPGPGGIPLDDEEMEDYEKECKKLLRKIWRLTHPDRIEQERFTPEQKKKLRSFFEEAVPYQDGGALDDEEIALTMRSLEALKELLAKVEAVWKSMGLDCNEHAVIQGETLEGQSAWLDLRINALEEEAGQVRAEIMAGVNDPESREMEACLASSEQINRITEEMTAKLTWYDEQIPILEQRLGELFGKQVIT
jgi:hypothetical protein